MKRIALVLLSFILLSAFKTADQPAFDTNAKLKSMFVYNFTKYIDWPESYKQGNFIIGFIGESSLQPELEKLAETKKAVNQTIEIRKFKSVSEIDKCHMIVVAAKDQGKVAEIAAKTKSQSTLLITEADGLIKQGAGINFIVVASKLKFELSKNNIESRNLKVASSLLSLAIVVD